MAWPHDGWWMPATPNLASSGLVACWCFSVQGVQGNSHPADSSKVCELDEGRHAVAPDSCHTGSICRYGYSTHAQVLSSGLGAVAYPLRNNYYNVLGGGGYNSHLHYVVPGLAAMLWPTTTLSCHMDKAPF